MLPLYTILSLYRCIVRSRLLLASVVSLRFVWGRASEIDSASRVRAPQLFPIYEACGYSFCLANHSIDGPIFIYRAQCRLGEQSPTRVQLMATTGLDRNLFWQLLPLILQTWLTLHSVNPGA